MKKKISCIVDGCNKTRTSVNYCGMHWVRMKRHGTLDGTRDYNGKTNTPMYNRYMGMISRCYNPKDVSFKNYGGRGITVSQRWLGTSGFENYCNDLGYPISSLYSVDRINNDGNYCKENCRWATRKEQSRNSRKCLPVIKKL